MADPTADPPRAPRTGEDRILTVPNAITVVRLACLPIFLYLLFGRDNRAAAAWLLAVLGATDFLDGFIARRFKQVSELGKVLDPVADRLLFFVGIGGVLIDGSIPLWFALLVLARETIVSVVTVALAALGAARIDVNWWGKLGALLLMFAVPWFLGAESTVSYADACEVGAYAVGIPGLLVSYYSAALYVPAARRALGEGRSARSGSTGVGSSG
ncbi:MAG: CDP-alcohol phosphatidyltransferase family protein [Acidimicrobiia bacterium]